MKLSLSLLVSSFLFATLVVGDDDGPSGDGDCDPCNPSCANAELKRGNKFIPRMLEFNDTSGWEDGEAYRWRKLPRAVGGFRDIKRAPNANFQLEFDCNTVPEICNNMCFGIYCKGHPSTLTINRGGCTAARKSNLCGAANPNYCSAKDGFAPNYSCDEYPFASTNEGSAAGSNAATRCVPKGQNSSQGGKISGLYRNGQGSGRLADGTPFTVTFANTGAAGYCGAAGGGNTNCGQNTGDQNSSGSQR